MFGGMGDVMKLLSQMGKIKENVAAAQERARNRSATGEAGAGLVKVCCSGLGEVVSVYIDPEALHDPEALGPLFTAACNVALQKSREILMEETRTAMGGIELPPDITKLMGGQG
jgi:nucleoid-associated protein EbfC